MQRQSATAAAAALAVAGLVGAWPLGAHGTQLTLGESTSGQYFFSPGGAAGFLNIAAASPILGAGTGFLPPDSGDWQLGALPATIAGPMQNGAFTTSATQSFSYTGGDGDSLGGLVVWSSLKDGSNFPDLIGNLTYTASGDADWLANWGTAGGATVDLTLDLFAASGPLEVIAATQQGSASGHVSAGEIQPQQSVPESGSLPMLATALACLGGLSWFKRRRSRT